MDLTTHTQTDDEPRAACAGRWELFDSTNLADHKRAAEFCAICPIKSRCEGELLTARRAQPIAGAAYGPQGTWAGLLLNPRQGRR